MVLLNKMLFSNNNSNYNGQQMNVARPALSHAPVARPVLLNAPMIDRVHKAKPGCSACGKKVM
jgi:hypothetical protein